MFRLVWLAALLPFACAGVSIAQPARNISFLGASAVGRSVVIVIGLPTGAHPSWRGVCLQTANTLRALIPEQSFDLILARDRDCLALSPDALLPATPANIDRAIDTLRRWESRGQGNPLPALELAVRLHPDLVYFLTGEDLPSPQSDAVALYCAQLVRGGGPRIHAIALTSAEPREIPAESPLTQSLRTIARAGGGDFRFATSAHLREETPPDHSLTIGRRTRMNFVGFSPDGQAACVEGTVNQLHVWQAIVYYWPEIAATLIGLILVATLLRAARNHHVVGEEYCRHCDYNLRGLPGTQCPECGTQLTPENRIAGSSRRPRLVSAACLLVCLVAAYPLAALRLPRQGSAGRWIDWRSVSLADWAITGKHQWLMRHTTHDTGIVRVDLDTGRITGLHCAIQQPTDERQIFTRMLSPDGRFLLCSLDNNAVVIECASGKVFRRYDFPCNQAIYTQIGTQTIFSCRQKELAAWDIQTGRKVRAVPVDRDYSLSAVVQASGHDQVVVLSGDDSGTTVRLWDPSAGAFIQTFCVQAAPRSCAYDGGRLYVARNSAADLTIETWDVRTGRRLTSTPTGHTLPRHPALRARHDWIAATSYDSETIAVNLRTGAWRSWQMRYPLPAISPDGRHLIAGFFCGAGHYDELRIHDLPQDP